jgi:protein-tyrosine phosphatase
MAEGSFKNLLREGKLIEKIYCDSAGTSGYHIGDGPDHRMCRTAARYNIILDHRARQIGHKDFEEFNYILAMDRSNFQNIQKLRKSEGGAKLFLFRDFDDQQQSSDVPDPYYGGQDGFEEVFRIVERCNRNLLEFLTKEHQLK